MADNGVVCSMSRSGSVWDNAAMESFFSSLKTERIGRRAHRTRDDARADMFDYIERFCNTVRRCSTIGYVSPVEFERKVGVAQLHVHETGSRRSALCWSGLLDDYLAAGALVPVSPVKVTSDRGYFATCSRDLAQDSPVARITRWMAGDGSARVDKRVQETSLGR